MPRSKRNKKVSLTQVKSDRRDHKQKVVAAVREAADKYARAFVFSLRNQRSRHMQHVRRKYRAGRIFCAKHTVVQLALGRSPEEDYRENLHQVSRHLRGRTGILFTDDVEKDVVEYFESLAVPDFADAGFVPDFDMSLAVGPIRKVSGGNLPLAGK